MPERPALPCAESEHAPFYDDGQITLYCGDALSILRRPPSAIGWFDTIVTDPPYGDTSLEWDRTPSPAWLDYAIERSRSLWCFGSLRFWLDQAQHFEAHGWRLAQDLVWEKHNGSGSAADRFKRVHEHALHWYRGEWKSLHRDVPTTDDAVKRTVRRKQRPPHWGDIGQGHYTSEDGGPRLQRSVIYCRSEHGRAVHETQKPLGILRPLITYSCPVDGVVLDPFAGSGSTLLAAREEGRRAIGIEAREDYCEAAVKRFAQGVLAA